MEITSLPLFNQEDYSYLGTIFQELDSHSDNALNKRRKLDDQESLNEIFDLLDDKKIPSSRYEVPSSGFENQALEMKSLSEGRARKTRISSPAASCGAGMVAEGGGQHRRFWVKERSKGWWKYHDSDECSDVEFRKAFRMSKDTFSMICDELEPAITKKDTMLRMAIPVRQRVAVCIYRLATGDPLRTTSSLFGLGIATCHKLVQEVCTAIKTILMPKFIQWPGKESLKEIKSAFGSISGIPNVNGSKPKTVILHDGLVDPQGMFTDVCIEYPGSMTDNQILEKSALSQRSNMGMLENSWVVGNSNYSLKDWILVPYTHQNLTWSQHMFNQKIGELENIAKDAFMRLKGRWGCLQKRTEVRLQELPMVLGACCVLHNICEMNNEEMDVDLRFELLNDHDKMDLGYSSKSKEHGDERSSPLPTWLSHLVTSKISISRHDSSDDGLSDPDDIDDLEMITQQVQVEQEQEEEVEWVRH
ncbi:antagonist of like heterochromatin protein 1-like protein [Tanacetum coccineum]